MKITCQDIYGKTHEFEDLEYIPRKSVYGVVLTNQNILLVQDRWVKQWGLPGGGIQDNETPLEALKREFIEETGLVIDTTNAKELTTMESYFLAPGRQSPWKEQKIVYMVTTQGNHTNIDAFDVIQAQYFSLRDIPKMTKDMRDIDLIKSVLQKLS